METFNGFRMVPRSGSGGPGEPGAQGPQGYQGSDGQSQLQWTISIESQESIYPAEGTANVYEGPGTLQLSFSTSTSSDVDASDWFTDLKVAVENDAGLFTIAQVDNRLVHRTIRITSVTEIYASGGSTAVGIVGEVISSAGNLYHNRKYFGQYSPLGAVGFQGPQGAAETVGGNPGAQGAVGLRGLYGHTGFQGPQGAQGVQGFAGTPTANSDPGPTGHQGHPGPAMGHQGSQGAQGDQGSQGAQGPTGPRGFFGSPGPADQGHQGAQGSQGASGSPGYQGHQGSTGPQGSIGQQGYTGAPGIPGAQGSQSASQGERGVQGAPGTRGPRGNQGSTGVQGTVGFVGIPGPTGTRGPQGYQGTNFSISKVYTSEAERTSATGAALPGNGEYALIGGDETSSDYGRLYLYSGGSWTYKSDMSMQGIQGPTGTSGDAGPQGYQGYPGVSVTGDRGAQGSTGTQGSQGTQGYQGVPGTGGSQGVQGDPGPQGYQGNTVLAPNGTGVIYISGGSSEVVTLGTGFIASGSLNSKTLRYRSTSGRPALDANHVHSWNCDEAQGSTSIVDSVGGKNLTLAGGEGTAYSLETYRFGSGVPWTRSLKLNNSSSEFAYNDSINLSGAITIEFVFVWQAFLATWLDVFVISNANFAFFLEAYNNGIYTIIQNSGGGHSYTPQNYSLSLMTPYHFMCVYDPSASSQNHLKLYINGVVTPGTTINGSISPVGNLTKISICGNGSGSPISSRSSAQGYIRDIRISNVARDATYALSSSKALLSL